MNESEELDVTYSVEELLNEISYEKDGSYVPSPFALGFVTFIKLVNDGNMENLTPVVHYRMLDKFIDGDDVINLCHRGMAKSTINEYLICYLGVYGKLEGLGDVPYALYVSDSMENGVSKMRKSLEFRWRNSEFLQQMIPNAIFTESRWELINASGHSLVVSGFGAKTGVRGTRENNSRPVLALLDDLISDKDARSPTVIASIENTVNNAIEYALHPTRRKVIWSGTPFNAGDPIYKALESGAWSVNVFPICEKFPCAKDDFRGSWEDRFSYAYVNKMYNKARKQGMLASFNQELMLRIMSDEDRIVQDSDIGWYDRKTLLNNISNYNIYFTTDFAMSESEHSDFSIIFVWAYSSSGDWFLVDWVVKRQLMDKNIDDLFMLAQLYKPKSVGIEVSGQQKGFISWIKREMLERNCIFPLASENNNGLEGLRPVGKKYDRFITVLPLFKKKQIHLPTDKAEDAGILEIINELRLIVVGGIKSKKDDCIDGISQLSSLKPWKPSHHAVYKDNLEGKRLPTTMFDRLGIEDSANKGGDLDSYIV